MIGFWTLSAHILPGRADRGAAIFYGQNHRFPREVMDIVLGGCLEPRRIRNFSFPKRRHG
jgi:hypothetical protein